MAAAGDALPAGDGALQRGVASAAQRELLAGGNVSVTVSNIAAVGVAPALAGGEGALQACRSVPADTNADAATAIAAVLLGGIAGGLQVDLAIARCR